MVPSVISKGQLRDLMNSAHETCSKFSDLAVGAFSSAQAVLLRARPVVTITGSLTSATSKLPISMPDLKFDFESCVYYTGYSAPPNLSNKNISKISLLQIQNLVPTYRDNTVIHFLTQQRYKYSSFRMQSRNSDEFISKCKRLPVQRIRV
jgi:hypothetical protein